MPADPTEDVELDTPSGASIAISVPGATEAHDAVVVDGITVYAQAAPETDIAVNPTSTGVQALITIDGTSAPTALDYGATVPEGGQTTISLGPDTVAASIAAIGGSTSC